MQTLHVKNMKNMMLLLAVSWTLVEVLFMSILDCILNWCVIIVFSTVLINTIVLKNIVRMTYFVFWPLPNTIFNTVSKSVIINSMFGE